MTSFSAGSDPWIITVEDRTKYDAQFSQLHPSAGFITGEQARNFFIQSGLSLPVLSQIWMLADMNADGKMDRREFAIAMYLIKRKLKGFELPSTLPMTLAQSLDSTTPGSNTVAQMMPVAYGSQTLPPNFTPGMPVLGVMSQPGPHVGGFQPTVPVMTNIQPARFTSPAKIPSSSVSGEWTIPQQQRLKYKQIFNSHDPTHKGFLTGMEAKAILSQTGLIHTTLAQIWCLSDIDVDGNLSPDEFCVALYLIDLAKMGQPMPPALPPGVVPPSYRRLVRPSESTVTYGPATVAMPSKPPDSFGELLGGLGFGTVVSSSGSASVSETDGKAIDSVITFEDRRKENFDKGQAELERRRAMLREQQQREAEARLAAEKAEQEKRERIRQEMELKKQQDLEKQFEKQRQLEMEREEQRRKAMEQREAARRELEHQRQLEWERQRRDQLMTEMQREHSHVDRLRLELGQGKLEFSSISIKLEELQSKIEQGRHSMAEFNQSIDMMRTSRDSKIANIEKLQSEVEDWNRKLSLAQQERLKLSHQSQGSSPMIDDEMRRLTQNCRSKRDNVERLSNEVASFEQRSVTLQQQIEALNELNVVLTRLQAENVQLEKELLVNTRGSEANSKQLSMDKVDGTPVKQNENTAKSKVDPFGDFNWDEVSKAFPKNPEDTWGQTAPQASTVDIWGQSSSVPASNGNSTSEFWSSNIATSDVSVNGWASFGASDSKVQSSMKGYTKYVALYDFIARSFDELTFKTGEEIWVKDDRTNVAPEWLMGKIGNTEGLFPEAFAQPVPATSIEANLFDPASEMKPLNASFVSGNVFSSISKSTQDVQSDSSFSQHQSITASADSSFNVVPPSAPSPTPGQKSQSAPEGMQVQALYPWIAKKDNHLTFAKGDIIIVKEQQDMWWSGELNGKIGWFPKSYVKSFPEAATSVPSVDPQRHEQTFESSGWTASFEASQSAFTRSATPQQTATPLQTQPVTSANQSPASQGSQSALVADTAANSASELCVALYSYTSNVTGDLAFNQGDVITLIQSEGDWWTGATKDNQIGIFPANYVKKMETTNKKKSRAPVAPSTLPHQTSDKNALSNQALRLSSGKKPEIATVLAPYQATGPEQLSLHPGQLIDVRKKNPSGWWEGELQARGQKRRIGWFPANYVKLLGQGGSATTTPDLTNSLSPRPHSADPQSERLSPVSLPAPTAAPSVDQVVAMYTYQKQNPDELDFNKGSIINVINKIDADWWMGELNGVTGLFPSNYVAPLTAVSSMGFQSLMTR